MAGVAVVAVCSPPTFALDGLSVDAGQATHTDMIRLSGQWNWSRRWLENDSGYLGAYWDAGFAQWDRKIALGQHNDLLEVGLTPVFRFQSAGVQGIYFEGGIGLHLLSSTHLGNKRFSSALQFGDHLGFGYRFGREGLEIGYRFRHLSNGGIKKPNDGIDYQEIRLQYWFR